MSATLHPPESVSPDHERQMEAIRLLLYADQVARGRAIYRVATVPTMLFALPRHSNCDCMDYRPWTY